MNNKSRLAWVLPPSMPCRVTEHGRLLDYLEAAKVKRGILPYFDEK